MGFALLQILVATKVGRASRAAAPAPPAANSALQSIKHHKKASQAWSPADAGRWQAHVPMCCTHEPPSAGCLVHRLSSKPSRDTPSPFPPPMPLRSFLSATTQVRPPACLPANLPVCAPDSLMFAGLVDMIPLLCALPAAVAACSMSAGTDQAHPNIDACINACFLCPLLAADQMFLSLWGILTFSEGPSTQPSYWRQPSMHWWPQRGNTACIQQQQPALSAAAASTGCGPHCGSLLQASARLPTASLQPLPDRCASALLSAEFEREQQGKSSPVAF